MSKLIHIMLGGPEYDIQVNGQKYHFEMHRYCGPVRLDEEGNEHCSQPLEFLHAASLWAQQGQRVEDGICRWDHEPEEILEQIGKRSFRIVGRKPAQRGE